MLIRRIVRLLPNCCVTVLCITVTCPKIGSDGRKAKPVRLQVAKRNFLVFRVLFFFSPIRKVSLVGEKVNSLEKLADVGRIIDRGSCFGRVFCTDATIATVRPARTGGHIWARSYGVVWAWLTRITRSHPSLSVSSLTQPSVLPTRGALDLSFFRQSCDFVQNVAIHNCRCCCYRNYYDTIVSLLTIIKSFLIICKLYRGMSRLWINVYPFSMFYTAMINQFMCVGISLV